MQLGMIGLGRMGANIVRRLMRHGHSCVVYDRSPDLGRQLAAEGATAAASLTELVANLAAPRAVWIMLPAGEATEAAIAELSGLLAAGDIIIDGGNSFWKDDVRRARELTPRLGVAVIDHAAVAMTHEAAGNARPHAPEADDADLHGRFLRSGPEFYSSAARRYYVPIDGGGTNLRNSGALWRTQSSAGFR